MTMDATEIQARARRRLASDRRVRKDPRYLRVIGRYVAAGLLEANHPVIEHAEPITVDDVLYVGRLEPRVLELLPAAMIKTPRMFTIPKTLPADLKAVVNSLRQSKEPADFRGIKGAKLLSWLSRIGRKNKLPSRLKSFRLQADEQRLLERISQKLELSETDVVRKALRELAAKELLTD